MKRLAIYAGVVAILVVVAAVAYARFGSAKASAAPNEPTATVQRGTLTATVNTSGNITAHQQVNLDFAQSGTVQKVDVNVGDHVKAGQVLAELDGTDLELQVQNAQANLKAAQDKLAQTRNPNAAQDITSARAKVDSAQAAYNKLTAGATASDLAAAQSQVASAQAAYDAAVRSAGTSSSQLTAAAAALDKAQQALQKAQAAYDRVASSPDIGARPEAANLQSATTDYNQAKANYEALAATAGTDAASKVAQARSQLDQAQANLAKLKAPPAPEDLAQAQDTLTQAKDDLDKLLAGADANSLDIAQTGVDQAEIALKQAQRQLQQAQIVAPFDGVVTQVNITPGQRTGSGAGTSGAAPAMQLADLAHLEIVSNLAEVDVSRIKTGQQAQVTLDALPDLTLNGQVSQIAPAGVQQQGVVNYPVTVALVQPPASVLPGMTANVNIVVDQRDNVLVVPNRAVRSQGRQKVVTVLFEGQQITTPVQTGLSNDTMTEITGGLKEGDTVLLNTTGTVARPNGPGGGGFGRGLGGPGFVGGR